MTPVGKSPDRTSALSFPELEKRLATYTLSGDTALMMVDLQDIFCSRARRDTVGIAPHHAARRARKLLPYFRKAGVQIYAVKYTGNDELWREMIESTSRRTEWRPEQRDERIRELRREWESEKRDYDFYQIRPDPAAGDIVVPKNKASVFESRIFDIEKHLKERGTRLIVEAGVYSPSCFLWSGLGALKAGFDLAALTDASAAWDVDRAREAASHIRSMQYLQREGAALARGADVVRLMAARGFLAA